MQEKIENALKKNLNPEFIEVINESNKHNVPKGAESHFKLSIVSKEFTGLTKIKRHKIVYQILSEIMNAIHALSLGLYTPEEWKLKAHISHSTPECAKQHKKT